VSLERNPQFHQIRRIIRTVVPDYRILANPQLGSGYSAVDLMKKTIEVSEGDDITSVIPLILFQVGHAIWHSHNKMDATLPLKDLARQNVDIDEFAASWATQVLHSCFDQKFNDASDQIKPLVWSYDDWAFYFCDTKE
jgi:hypothetical protein